MTVLNSF